MIEQTSSKPEGAEDWHPAVKEYIHTEGEDKGRIKAYTAEQQNAAMGMAGREDKERSGESGQNVKGVVRGAIFSKANRDMTPNILPEERDAELAGIHRQIEELGNQNTPEENAAYKERIEREDNEWVAEQVRIEQAILEDFKIKALQILESGDLFKAIDTFCADIQKTKRPEDQKRLIFFQGQALKRADVTTDEIREFVEGLR